MIYGLNAILYYLGYFIFIIKKIFNKKKEPVSILVIVEVDLPIIEILEHGTRMKSHELGNVAEKIICVLLYI